MANFSLKMFMLSSKDSEWSLGSHLYVEISTVIFLPRLELHGLHLLGGDIQNPGNSALRETKHRVKSWLEVLRVRWRNISYKMSIPCCPAEELQSRGSGLYHLWTLSPSYCPSWDFVIWKYFFINLWSVLSFTLCPHRLTQCYETTELLYCLLSFLEILHFTEAANTSIPATSSFTQQNY